MAEVKKHFLDTCVFCTTLIIGILSAVTLAVLVWTFTL